MDDIAIQLQAINERNRRVEADKAWEISWTRRGFVTAITYCTASLFLWMIGAPNPFVAALVPTGGYLLSTLSLPWLKRLWLQNVRSTRNSAAESIE